MKNNVISVNGYTQQLESLLAHLQHEGQLTSTFTFPFTFSISPNIAEIKDDFPQPTLPTIATRLPLGTVTLMLQKY